jgi:hypothetical protein
LSGVVKYPAGARPSKCIIVIIFPNVDPEDGHPIAYEAILQGRQQFENPLLLLKDDSEQVLTHPVTAEKAQVWMATARQVAVGNRRRVFEDGDDKINSSDEDDEHMEPDKLTGMYTSEMDPKAGPHKLTQGQAAYQRAAGKARKEQMILSTPHVESPEPEEAFEASPQVDLPKTGGSSDDDTLDRPEYIWSVSKGINRRNKDSQILPWPFLHPDPNPNGSLRH